MKSKFLLSLLFATCLQSVTAQSQPPVTAAMNEQFGTLLESLLVNGKLNPADAKLYLETIYGNDPSVTSYLQSVNFADKLATVNKGKLSQSEFLTALNNTLIGSVPESYRQQLAAKLQAQQIVDGVVGELNSGKIGVNTVALMGNLISDLQAGKEKRLRKEEAARKLAYITPRLNKIMAADTIAFTKLKIVDEVDSPRNWIAFNNPRILQDGDPETSSTNHALLQNGYLTLSDPYKLRDKQLPFFDYLRCYKNPDKFDFSKDFAMTLHFKMNDKQANGFNVEVAKGYHVTVTRNFNGAGRIYLQTPNKYATTDVYGKLTSEKIKDNKRDSKKIDKELGILWLTDPYASAIYFPKKALADPNGMLKLTIVKKGNVFTVKFNDLPGELSSVVDYFPDKYSLAFSSKCLYEGGSVTEIHTLELEHL